MRSIEIFSGTGKISKILESYGFEIFTIDINPKYKPSLVIDILKLRPELLHNLKPIDFAWFSPDCTMFSRAGHSQDWYKDIIKYRRYLYKPLTNAARSAVKMIEKTFEIIDYLDPESWFIENPVGRLRHLDIIRKKAPFRYSINYKDWGFDYSKETDIFTNIMLPFSSSVPLRLGKSVQDIKGKYNRSAVPEKFIHFLIKFLYKNVTF